MPQAARNRSVSYKIKLGVTICGQPTVRAPLVLAPSVQSAGLGEPASFAAYPGVVNARFAAGRPVPLGTK